MIVCVTSKLGTLLIHAQIVGATGLPEHVLTKVLPLFEIFSFKRIVGGIVFHKYIF